MGACTVKSCYQGRADGDNLFCTEHRANWRIFVERMKMTLRTPNILIKKALKEFQGI